MNETKHTPGPWVDGKTSDSIVSASQEHDDLHAEYYGGYLIAESIAPHNRPIIKAAPDLLTACEELLARLEQVNPLPEGGSSSMRDYARAAIAAAKGTES